MKIEDSNSPTLCTHCAASFYVCTECCYFSTVGICCCPCFCIDKLSEVCDKKKVNVENFNEINNIQTKNTEPNNKFEDYSIRYCSSLLSTLLYFDKLKLYCCCPFLLCLTQEYKDNIEIKIMNKN